MLPIRVLFFIFIVIFFSCSKNEEKEADCFPTIFEPSIVLEKSGTNCDDIDFVFEISFGVKFSATVEADCAGMCDENRILCGGIAVRKNSIETDTIVHISANLSCGRWGGILQTLNTKIEEPQRFFVGDTIYYRLYNFSICPEVVQDHKDCTGKYVPIEHPPIEDYYIVVEEDFCS